MKNSISLLIFLWLPTYIHSECCPKVTLNFYKCSKDKSCKDFGGTMPYPNGNGGAAVPISEATGNLINGACIIQACGNGKPPDRGHYCGRGPCNVFGCNCDGGCIPGNSKDEFMRIHGDAVQGVTYTFLDSLKYHEKSCCVKLFEGDNWKGESVEICDCDEKCINLSDEWKDRISSAHLKISNNLMLYSQENCKGKELKVPGSVGLFSGRYCRRNFGDNSLISGCSTTALNDNSHSIKILHKSAIGSYIGVIV